MDGLYFEGLLIDELMLAMIVLFCSLVVEIDRLWNAESKDEFLNVCDNLEN